MTEARRSHRQAKLVNVDMALCSATQSVSICGLYACQFVISFLSRNIANVFILHCCRVIAMLLPACLCGGRCPFPLPQAIVGSRSFYRIRENLRAVHVCECENRIEPTACAWNVFFFFFAWPKMRMWGTECVRYKRECRQRQIKLPKKIKHQKNVVGQQCRRFCCGKNITMRWNRTRNTIYEYNSDVEPVIMTHT